MKREHATELRREDIVLAALQCFIQKGFHQASMRDIASAAGVSLGNVYNHFPSKDALIAEIAAVEMAELSPLTAALEMAEPLAGLLAFAHDYLGVCAQPDNVMLSCEVYAEAARQPSLAALFSDNHRRLVDVVERAVRHGVASGALDATLSPRAMAELLLDAVEGQALRSTLFSKPSQRPKATVLQALLSKLLVAPKAVP